MLDSIYWNESQLLRVPFPHQSPWTTLCSSTSSNNKKPLLQREIDETTTSEWNMKFIEAKESVVRDITNKLLLLNQVLTDSLTLWSSLEQDG